MVTKTIRISDECDAILKHMVKSTNSKSESSYIEKLIMSVNEVESDYENSMAEKIDLIYNEILQLKVISKNTDKKSYILSDILNSLITKGMSVDDNDYTSAEKNPHSWVTKSEQNLKNKIYAQQTQKLNESGYKNFGNKFDD